MFRKRLFLPLIVVILLLTITPINAGGWSVATLDSLPGCVAAEEPLAIGFVVRQHGVSVLEDLAPTVFASQEESGELFTITAEEDTPGHYAAELVFPVGGTWEWTISAFGPEQPMPSLAVLPSGENCPAESDIADDPEALVELGLSLFVSKGCVVCHQHDAASFDAFASINSGPDLTGYHSEPDFLCRWLDDPAGLKPGTYMPTLGLSGDEIEALIMFLNADAETNSEIPESGWCGDLLASAVDQ
jgi:mono/diheme cytochrome c family protein